MSSLGVLRKGDFALKKYKRMRELVERGYNLGHYAAVFRERSTLTDFERRMLEALKNEMAPGSNVLDIGSGSGTPFDSYLVQVGYNVIGIDLSEKQISLARQNVPSAEYIQGCFLEHPFQAETYDAVLSLYVMFHLPREMHELFIKKCAQLLKPRGVLLLTAGTEDEEYKERTQFCGSLMAWSYYDKDTYLRMVTKCGFSVLLALNEKNFGSNEKHLWILARKK